MRDMSKRLFGHEKPARMTGFCHGNEINLSCYKYEVGQADQGELIALRPRSQQQKALDVAVIAYVPVKVARIDENAADSNYIAGNFNKRGMIFSKECNCDKECAIIYLV